MGFWKWFGEILKEPVVIGNSEDIPEILRAYNERKAIEKNPGKVVDIIKAFNGAPVRPKIHLHQHKYLLVDKETGEEAELDPEKHKIIDVENK